MGDVFASKQAYICTYFAISLTTKKKTISIHSPIKSLQIRIKGARCLAGIIYKCYGLNCIQWVELYEPSDEASKSLGFNCIG